VLSVLGIAMSTLPAAAVATVPSQIGTVAITSVDSALKVRATAPANNGSTITRYVAKCTGHGSTTTVSGLGPVVTVASLTNNAFYACSIHAVNAIGAGPESYVRPGMPGVNYTQTTYTYCSPGGTALHMDVLRPNTAAPVPVVMFVHGGGWYSGSRNVNGTLLATLLTSRGFAFASVDYRLAPAVNPAQQLRDIACAVRFIRAHATLLGVKSTKIGGIGSSAGGNLVSMLGVNPPPVVPTDQWAAQSEKLQGVIDEFGVNEFTPDQMKLLPSVRHNFGTTDQSVINSYGPVQYVTPDDAPFLIVHGVQDAIVPVHSGRDFYNLLQAAHVSSTFVPISNMGHMFVPTGGNPNPTMTTVYTDEVHFLMQFVT
jgi:acetyl esterase/lipase